MHQFAKRILLVSLHYIHIYAHKYAKIYLHNNIFVCIVKIVNLVGNVLLVCRYIIILFSIRKIPTKALVFFIWVDFKQKMLKEMTFGFYVCAYCFYASR